MTASVPELEKRTSSAAGTICEMRSATLYSRSVESANTPPTSMPWRGRLIHTRIGVAEDRRAIAHPVVDVDVVVEVGDTRAAPLLYVDGAVFAPEAEVGGDTQGQTLERAPVMLVVSGQVSGHGSAL